jgi:predicted PurR-regulated permease PerM
MQSLYTHKQRSILHLIIILAIGLVIFAGLYNYLTSMIASFILYVLFLKPFRYWTIERKGSPTLAALVIIVLSFVIIVLPFLFLSILLTNKILYYSANPEDIIATFLQVEKFLDVDFQSKAVIRELIQKGGTLAANLFPSIVSSTLEMIIAITLMYFILYFTFTNEKAFLLTLQNYLPFDEETNFGLGDALKKSVNANVIGQSLISLVQAILVAIGFLIFGFKDVWFWGIVSFFCAFIPVLGTPLVWLPAGLIALGQGNSLGGFGIIIYGAVLVMNIDNVLRMIIGKKMGDIHPLVTVVGVIFGVPIFGIIGLVIGPLLISYFLLLVESYHRRYGKENEKIGEEITQNTTVHLPTGEEVARKL